MIDHRDIDYYSTHSPPNGFAFHLSPRDYSPTDISFMSASMADSRRPLTNTLYEMDTKMHEANGFQNPFSSVSSDHLHQQQQQPTIDPHYIPSSNTSSSWQSPPTTAGVSYAPMSAGSAHPCYSNVPGMRPAPMPMSRPQTSDGLPTNYMNGPLPGARTLVNPIHQSGVPGSYAVHGSGGELVGGFPARYGSFDQASTRYMAVGLPSAENSQLQFVSLAGPAPKKRSRRRYDEIERIYACDWRGCDKAYGTLNHLNAHVAMQKHGPKRLPAQFKEMRKEWRRKKREEAANAANKEYAAAGTEQSQNAQPPSSDPYSYRPSQQGDGGGGGGGAQLPPMSSYASGPSYSSASSMPHMQMQAPEPFGHRGSAGSFLSSTTQTWSGSDTRPTTANTVSSAGSPGDNRFAYNVSQWPSSNGYDRKNSLPSLPQSTAPPANFTPYMMSQKGMI